MANKVAKQYTFRTLKTEYRNQNNQVSKTSTACRGKKTEAEKDRKGWQQPKRHQQKTACRATLGAAGSPKGRTANG